MIQGHWQPQALQANHHQVIRDRLMLIFFFKSPNACIALVNITIDST